MKTRLFFCLCSLFFAVSCASTGIPIGSSDTQYDELAQGEGGESATGLGASPFSTGGRFTAANGNSIVNAIDAIYAIVGFPYCDGSDCAAGTAANIAALFSGSGNLMLTDGTKTNAVPDGITATTQAPNDFTSKLATNLYVQTASSTYGHNIIADPNFYQKSVNSLSTWQNISGWNNPTYGLFGSNGRYGIKLTHNASTYTGAINSTIFPIKYGDKLYYKYDGYLDATYTDDGDHGITLQVTYLDDEGNVLASNQGYSGVGTLGTFFSTEGTFTATEDSATQYAVFYVYIYDSALTGTGYAVVDSLLVASQDGTYLSPTGDARGVQLELGGCASGTCTATDILKDKDIDLGTGTIDMSDKTILLPEGGSYYADENVAPTLPGQFKYDNLVTGFDDGAPCWYDDDEVKCVVSLGASDETLESADDGKVLRYNWNSGAGYFNLVDNKESIGMACSDESTNLTTGTAKVTFRMPFAMTLSEVRASVNTAPVGSTIIVDINEGGATVLSTKLTIDASEKTSTTAATPAVISDSALADDAEITIDIDQIGSGTAGTGLKVWLIGTK